jgi:salicylate hydroxylase
VQLYEQADEIAEFGAGVQVSPNCARVLSALGLGEELARIGTEVPQRDTRLWNTGQSWPQMRLGSSAVERYGFGHFTVHRADLQRVLLEAVEREKPGAVRVGSKAVGFVQSEANVELVLAGGQCVHGDALIGADGIHSVLRQRLFGEDAPRFTGCVAWRGMAPAECLPETLRGRVSQWIAPRAHLIHYPIRGGRLVNMIGVLERDDWRIESWSERGTHEECLRDFAGWHEDALTLIRSIEVPFKWALMAREPLQRWTVGRVSLLGDACHPALPYLAQGAAMAIEDAFTLARCAAMHDPAEALKRYEAVRVPRATRMVHATIENLHAMHTPALAHPQTAAAHVEAMNSPEAMRGKYDWLYGFDAVASPLEPVGATYNHAP